jgi:GTP-binding protein Era
VKCGYIAIVGRPNVGKSTLLNRLVGQKVSIISEKPQTTRHRILGIRTSQDVQMIFVDTPGIHRPEYRMNVRMMDFVYEAVRGVDLLVHMVDASEGYGKGEQFSLDLVKKAEKPAILLLNKVDLINKGRLLPQIQFYDAEGNYSDIIPASALRGENVDVLTERIIELLPEREFLYSPEFVTDQHERFLVGEIVREKVLLNTRQELPYSTAVLVEDFDESRREEGFVRIMASVIVERDGQKKIVIGRAGQMIKRIGTQARKEIQSMLQVRQVYLDLSVKVVPDWRNREGVLDQLAVS